MKPMTKAAFSPRTITAAVGVALALALTGCGGDKDESQKKTDEAAQTEKADDGGGMQGKAAPGESESASAPAPSKSAGSEPSKSKDLFADAPRTTSWASDDGIKVNKEGDGTVPKASLQADIDDLFKNKFKMDVDAVECRDDMKVIDWWGLTSCEVQTKKKTYFGTVKLVDHKDNMIKYEVKFPGLDKKEVDF